MGWFRRDHRCVASEDMRRDLRQAATLLDFESDFLTPYPETQRLGLDLQRIADALFKLAERGVDLRQKGLT